jgi:bisphosphoglycerate-independent phosphoglycerate mutase (AlkP superfamily)
VDARGQVLNDFMKDITPAFEDVAYDAFVFHGAIDYLKSNKPRVLYVAFGETDDWAHDGHYDRVLKAARHTDGFIRRLWESAQSMPEYRDKTTLIIATDHGRGSGLKEWKDHGEKTQGSEYIWVAVMGPDTPALGERSNTPLITQGQIAASVAVLLGEDYCAAFPQAARPIAELVGK